MGAVGAVRRARVLRVGGSIVGCAKGQSQLLGCLFGDLEVPIALAIVAGLTLMWVCVATRCFLVVDWTSSIFIVTFCVRFRSRDAARAPRAADSVSSRR